MKKTWWLVASLALVSLPVVTGTSAAGPDAQRAPWLGCWQPMGASTVFGGGRVCVAADGTAQLKVISLDGDRVLSEETIAIGGASSPVTDDGCQGTAKARWATARPALYRQAEFDCGAEGRRTVSSVWFVRQDRVWIDVTVREVGGTSRVRVRRLHPSADQGVPEGVVATLPGPRRMIEAIDEAGSPWTAAAVIEASGQLPREGVQAALSESPTDVTVNAKALAQMSDAGVDATVIDLMVALAYPERFVVRRAAGGGIADDFGGSDLDDEWIFGPAWTMAFGPGAFAFGARYWLDCYGFSGCWTYPYGYGYYGNGHWVVVGSGSGIAGGSGTGTGGGVEVGRGRAVKGLGYTQVAVRGDSPASSAGGSGGGAGGAGGAGASSGGQASPSGYSGGSSAGGADRTAQPRGPGGQ